ncbi:MAG: amino acid permease [Bdellovibrionales bacterium]|nr:amino acid permease [Bdellovibrionales bacterium]
MFDLFVKKSIPELLADATDKNTGDQSSAGLKRHLGAFNLTMLGIGAIVGAGIFSLTGTAAANYAGPGIVYSFIIGGILCALAGLCYSEMAAMVPVAGSAYAYSYATMGELIAWIIGWDLVLEYAFGAVTVSASWSGYLVSLFTKTLGIPLTDSMLMFTKGPWELVTLSNGAEIYGYWNLPASVIALLVTMILYKGIKESATMNNIIVMVKIAIILLFIALGWAVIDTNNWIANPDASGPLALIPPPSMSERHGQSFWSYGFPGVLTGAGVVFFSYIGFDAVSTTAQEAKNPQRDMPIGILASLVICTIIYILMSLTMTGVVSYKELGVADPVAVGVDRIVALRQWTPWAQGTLSFVVKFGALAGLTSVMLVMMIGQTRVFYSMGRDGLLPWFDRTHAKFQTPHVATVITGIFVAICGGAMPMSLVGELVSIGTLLAFVLVCIGVPILRITQPHLERPFKTPLAWIVAPAGALACLWVMSGLPLDTWLRLLVWLMFGFVIYFTYGIKHSRIRKKRLAEKS